MSSATPSTSDGFLPTEECSGGDCEEPGSSEGRLVFDPDPDMTAPDELLDALFPSASSPRRSIPSRVSSAAERGGEEGGEGEAERAEGETEEGEEEGDAIPSGTPSEETKSSLVEDLEEELVREDTEEELPPHVRAVLERRQLTRERLQRRQRAVRELMRRSRQPTPEELPPPVWSPPIKEYRPPPLPVLHKNLKVSLELADMVPESPRVASWQIDEFMKKCGLRYGDDTPR